MEADPRLRTIPQYPNYFSKFQLSASIICANVLSMGIILGLHKFLHAAAQQTRKIPSSEMSLKKPSAAERLCGIILIFCFGANVLYKWLLGWRYLGYLLYPCHVLSLCYIYVIFGKAYRRVRAVWCVVVNLTYFTVMALLSPDTSDLFFFLQPTVFWIHHITLLVTPLVILVVNRVSLHDTMPSVTSAPSLLPSRVYWFLITLSITTLFCFNIQLPLSIVLGININYLYWPPPGHIERSLLSGPYYHLKMALLLTCLTWIFGFPIVWIVEWFRGVLLASFEMGRCLRNTTNTKSK
jgi:hypothetical protein